MPYRYKDVMAFLCGIATQCEDVTARSSASGFRKSHAWFPSVCLKGQGDNSYPHELHVPLLVQELINPSCIFVFPVSLGKSVLIHRNLNISVNSLVHKGHLILCFKITLLILRSLPICAKFRVMNLFFSLAELKNLMQARKKILLYIFITQSSLRESQCAIRRAQKMHLGSGKLPQRSTI